MSIEIVIDGAARLGQRRSVGEAACAAVFFRAGKPIDKVFRTLGPRTNNEAEYEALILALICATARNLPPPVIYTDSAVVANQVNGIWRTRDPKLLAMLFTVANIKEGYQFFLRQVPRDRVHAADKLCNEALDNLITFKTKGLLR